MPPEVFSNAAPVNCVLRDLWALGIILFTLICGFPPFNEPSIIDPCYRMYCNNQFGVLLARWRIEMSPLAWDLIQKILRPVPQERLTLEEIMQHPWIVEEDH